MSPLRLSIERGGGRAVSRDKGAARLGCMPALSLSNEMGGRSRTKNHNLALMLPAGSRYITNRGRTKPTKFVKSWKSASSQFLLEP